MWIQQKSASIVKAGIYFNDTTKCAAYAAARVDSAIMRVMPISRWNAVISLVLLLLIAVIARVSFSTLDFNSLLSTYLVDDAFYYFKIASHLATEHRITYDGDQLTNGFHPLWLAVITPFYTPADNGIAFVYRVQWLMVLIDLLSVVALYRTLLQCKTGVVIAFIASFWFCVHSTFIDIQMNGLETSLNTLLLLMLLSAFVAIFLNKQASSSRYWYFGAVAGLAFLARTDNAIALVVLFAALFLREYQQRLTGFRPLFASAALAGLLALPWLLWNWIHFGSLVQSSGKIETIYWGEPHFSWQRVAFEWLMLPIKVFEQMKLFVRLFIAPSGNAAWMSAGWLLFFGSALLWFWRSRRVSTELKAVAVFCVAVLAVFCYHAAFRSFVRTWYFIPVGLVLLLLLAGMAAALQSCEQELEKNKMRFVVSLLLLAICTAQVLISFSPSRLPGVITEHSTHLTVAKWLNNNTPSDAVIGSMNSGVLSYLVHRKVINLDGVVDVRSMRAHWDKKQPEYLHERGIQYLVDNAGALNFFCRDNPYHTCEKVFAFGDAKNPSLVVRIVNK